MVTLLFDPDRENFSVTTADETEGRVFIGRSYTLILTAKD